MEFLNNRPLDLLQFEQIALDENQATQLPDQTDEMLE